MFGIMYVILFSFFPGVIVLLWQCYILRLMMWYSKTQVILSCKLLRQFSQIWVPLWLVDDIKWKQWNLNGALKSHFSHVYEHKTRRRSVNRIKITTWRSRSSQIAGSSTQQLLLCNNATFDDIILQHLMTSFWMTCTFWILNKQVKNSFLKLCTIFHRSSLDLDLDLDVV